MVNYGDLQITKTFPSHIQILVSVLKSQAGQVGLQYEFTQRKLAVEILLCLQHSAPTPAGLLPEKTHTPLISLDGFISTP